MIAVRSKVGFLFCHGSTSGQGASLSYKKRGFESTQQKIYSHDLITIVIELRQNFKTILYVPKERKKEIGQIHENMVFLC